MNSTKISNNVMDNVTPIITDNIGIVYPDIVQVQMEYYCEIFKIVLINSKKTNDKTNCIIRCRKFKTTKY